MKSSPLIWHLLHNVKSTVNISPVFVAFLENMNFTKKRLDHDRKQYFFLFKQGFEKSQCPAQIKFFLFIHFWKSEILPKSKNYCTTTWNMQ